MLSKGAMIWIWFEDEQILWKEMHRVTNGLTAEYYTMRTSTMQLD